MSEVTRLGCQIHRRIMDDADMKQHLQDLGVHRDDHYVFLLHEGGCNTLMVDFSEQVLEGKGLYFILPGQVHEIRMVSDLQGWFLAVDAHLLDEVYVPIFQDIPEPAKWLSLAEGEGEEMLQCLQMIETKTHSAVDNTFAKPILHGLVKSFTGMVAEKYALRCRQTGAAESRAVQVTRAFRALLRQRFREMKSPAAYAEAFHVSPSYLNELVKSASGFPVSYWIQYEIMLEARRLLYYSDLSVQEVSFDLGYEDPTYFSRVFRQVVGESPVRFRQLFRS